MQTSLTRRRSRLARPLSWLVVAGLAGAALIGPGAGGVGAISVIDWATVTGYAPGGSDNNHADTWSKLLGVDCIKLDNGNLGDTYLLSHSYAWVIVKAGSEQSAPGHVNTIFAGASAGETVWADSSGNGAFGEGDKGISHIIFCGPQETTTTTSDTTTTRTSDTTTETTTDTESETTSETTATDTDSTTSDTTTQTSTDTESETTSETTATDTDSTTTDSTTSETSTGSESETTSTATETTVTDTDSTTTETSTGTESESTSTATTDTSPTGEELGATGTPGLTPPATDTVAAASTTGGPDGLRIVLLGFAMVLAVILLLQPKDSTKRR